MKKTFFNVKNKVFNCFLIIYLLNTKILGLVIIPIGFS